MKILTLQLMGHDANVTYYDGTNVKYLNLERLTRVKKYAYNYHNLRHVREHISSMNIDYDDLDIIAFTYLSTHDDDWKFDENEQVKEVTQEQFDYYHPHLMMRAKKYFRVRHHYCHKRTADWLFGDAPKALVIDGHGDYKEHISVFDKETKLKEHRMSDMLSIGRLYSLSSLLLMEIPQNSEIDALGGTVDNVGKIMGLMSYGEYNKDYADWLRQFKFEDVTYEMYNRLQFERFQHLKKIDIVKGCSNGVGMKPDYDTVDWLHTWQEVLFDYIIDFTKQYFDKDEVFSFSGGVAHNVCLNERLSKEFPNMVIPPCVGDEGLSLGIMYEMMQRYNILEDFPKGQFTQEKIEDINSTTVDIIIDRLALGKVVVNYQGLSEIGPRALGRRSIFFRTDLEVATKMFHDRHIKHREWWRPYGIIILEEELSNYLDTTVASPHMLHTAQVINKEALKGVVHVDNSVRYQTVNKDDGWLYDIVKGVHKRTGVPAIINTSLNQHGLPIMYSEAEFYNYMQQENCDVYAIGNEVYEHDND